VSIEDHESEWTSMTAESLKAQFLRHSCSTSKVVVCQIMRGTNWSMLITTAMQTTHNSIALTPKEDTDSLCQRIEVNS